MKFADNIWWTRKARIQAEKRLLANAFQTQILLLWYSFFSVAISIYFLQFAVESNYAGISWVVFSVLILCISGFINGLNFKERALLIKECYETLNGLYHKAKQPGANIPDISAKYEQVLNICENHIEIDYYIAMCEIFLTRDTSKEPDTSKEDDASKNHDKNPTPYIWLKVIIHISRRWMYLLLFYLLPIALFLVMGYMPE